MKKFVFQTLVAFMVIFFCITNALAAPAVPELVMNNADSVVRIEAEFETEYSSGSGFVVGKDSDSLFVVTNYHVVEGTPLSLCIWIDESETANAEIVSYSAQRDLCLLRLDSGSEMPVLSMAQSIEKGSAIYAVGYPSAADALSDTEAHTGEEATITDGIVSAIRKATLIKNGDPVELLQISAAINPGNSGGPLFNADGEVVGVNTYGIYDAQGVFGAISVDELVDFLEDNNILPQYSMPSKFSEYWTLFVIAAVIVIGLITVMIHQKRVRPFRVKETEEEKQRKLVSDRQHFFDNDYGYSVDNPFVVSSVRMEGCYLSALRTPDQQSFTWERQPCGSNPDVDSYKLFVNGALYRVVFFNPHGYDSQQLPDGLCLDIIALEAAKQGISAEQAQRNIEREQKKEEFKKKRKILAKKIVIVAVAVVGLLACGCAAYVHGYPYIRYIIAEKELERGNYEKATQMFASLGGYKSSEEYYRQAVYETACMLLENGKHTEALAAFELLGNYKDASLKSMHVKYLLAEADYAVGSYFEAQEQFRNLGEYENAPERVMDCEYQLAIQEMDSKMYYAALDRLEAMAAYSGKQAAIAECHYQLMLSWINELQWSEAYKHYRSVSKHDPQGYIDLSPYQNDVLTGYAKYLLSRGTEDYCLAAISVLDSISSELRTTETIKVRGLAEEHLNEIRYVNAKEAYANADYSRAGLRFEEVLNYKDSHSFWLESMYQSVLDYLNSEQQFSSKYFASLYATYADILIENNYKDSTKFIGVFST